MYRMGMMSLLASDCGVDGSRCMKMALVHDVAEAIVGDITPHCRCESDERSAACKQEQRGMTAGCDMVSAAGVAACSSTGSLIA